MIENIQIHHFDLTQIERAKIKNQTPMCLWMTGLSWAVEFKLANIFEQEQNRGDKYTYNLDGDNLRQGLNSDLGFKREVDRNQNMRRAT